MFTHPQVFDHGPVLGNYFTVGREITQKILLDLNRDSEDKIRKDKLVLE